MHGLHLPDSAVAKTPLEHSSWGTDKGTVLG